MESEKNIGKRVQDAIRECGLTQVKVCELLTYSTVYLSNIIHGKKKLNEDLAIKLTNLLNKFHEPQPVGTNGKKIDFYDYRYFLDEISYPNTEIACKAMKKDTDNYKDAIAVILKGHGCEVFTTSKGYVLKNVDNGEEIILSDTDAEILIGNISGIIQQLLNSEFLRPKRAAIEKKQREKYPTLPDS